MTDKLKTDEDSDLSASAGSVQDSRLCYISGHFFSWSKNLIVFGAIVWLAYALQSGLILWAFLICPWSNYKHDFNSQNAKDLPPANQT